MKRSIHGLIPARRLGSSLALGLAAAVAAAVVVTACGGSNNTHCPNMAIADSVLGQTSFTSGNPDVGGVSAATLNGPFGTPAINSAGNLFYVTDAGNNRILGYTSMPSGSGAAANFELGQGGTAGNDFTDSVAATTQTGLAGPSKAAIGTDAAGNQIYLVVADTGNNRVLIWNGALHGNQLPGVSGAVYAPDVVVGQPDFTSGLANQNAAPSASTLSHPTAAVIAHGTLVVVDQNNNRVLLWNAVPAANGAPADIELGQNAAATQNGTVVDCTTNSGASGYCFATNDANTDTFIANNAGGSYILGVNQPTDVATDGFNFLMISDTQNNRVVVYRGMPNTNNQFPNVVLGQSAFVQNLASSGNSHMNAPLGISYANGYLYVADAGNNRLLVFTASSIQALSNGIAAGYLFGQADFTHVAFNDNDQNGQPGSQQNGKSNTNPTFNTLHTPTGAVADNAGHLYLADTGNNRILRFASAPNVSAASPVSGTQPNNCNGTNPQVN